MRSIIPATFLLLTLAGCAKNVEQSAVQAVLIQRQQAMNNKDAKLYIPLLSPNYQDKNQDYAAKKRELVENFTSFEKVTYRSDGFTIQINGNQATASGHYSLRVIIGGKELNLEGDESIRLNKESGNWKITGGL